MRGNSPFGEAAWRSISRSDLTLVETIVSAVKSLAVASATLDLRSNTRDSRTGDDVLAR
jgi:hypothetical protein